MAKVVFAGESQTPLFRHNVRVTFEDGNSLVTGINGTEQEIRDYYLKNKFNLGKGMVRGTKVEFLD